MNYDKIISIVKDLHNDEEGLIIESTMKESAYKPFPFKYCYDGQNEAIQTIIEEDVSLLCSHTGSGKSACFLTAAHELNIPTIVIEPRKFLQKQIGEYFKDFVLYGKSNYPCRFAPSAASAPCVKTHQKKGKKYFSIRNQLTGKIDEKLYPCVGCEYLTAKDFAKFRLKDNGVLVVNFGNFWQWLRYAEFVVIDEADEFFRAISSGIDLDYVYETDYHLFLEGDRFATLDNLLLIEINSIELSIEEIKIKETIDAEDARELQEYQRRLQKLEFFLLNSEECFLYRKKKSIYVELQPNKTSVLLDRMFQGKKVCIVTATPSQFMERVK